MADSIGEQNGSHKSQDQNGKTSSGKRHVRAWGEKNMSLIKNTINGSDSDSDNSVDVVSLASNDLSDSHYSSESFGSKLTDPCPSPSTPHSPDKLHKAAGSCSKATPANSFNVGSVTGVNKNTCKKRLWTCSKTNQHVTAKSKRHHQSNKREKALSKKSNSDLNKHQPSSGSDEFEEDNQQLKKYTGNSKKRQLSSSSGGFDKVGHQLKKNTGYFKKRQLSSSSSSDQSKEENHKLKKTTAVFKNLQPSSGCDAFEEENHTKTMALKAQTTPVSKAGAVSVSQLLKSRKRKFSSERKNDGKEPANHTSCKVAGTRTLAVSKMANRRRQAIKAKHFKQILHKGGPKNPHKKKIHTAAQKNHSHSQRHHNALPRLPFEDLFSNSSESEDDAEEASEQGETKNSGCSASGSYDPASDVDPESVLQVEGPGQQSVGTCEPEQPHSGDLEQCSSLLCAMQGSTESAEETGQVVGQPEPGCSHNEVSGYPSNSPDFKIHFPSLDTSDAQPEEEKRQPVQPSEKPHVEPVRCVCDDQECLLVIPEDVSAFEDISQWVREGLAGDLGVEESHVHTWDSLHPPHLLPPDCTLYYFHDLARAMEDSSWDEVEDLLLNSSTLQEKLETSYKKAKMQGENSDLTRSQHTEKNRRLVSLCLKEARLSNSYLMGMLTSRADVHFIVFFINNISDPKQNVRSALHHSKVFPLNPDHVFLSSSNAFLPSHRCDYTLLESTVLLNWFRQNFSKYRVVCVPEEQVFRLDSGDGPGFDMLKSKLADDGCSESDVPVVILMYRVKASLVHFENYLQACLSQYAKCSGRLRVACVFPKDNLRGEMCGQMEVEGERWPVRFFAAFNPAHRPVSMLVAEVRRQLDHG
ncbi:hypothetical protein ACOMHN_020888 [Nucella lapillus]